MARYGSFVCDFVASLSHFGVEFPTLWGVDKLNRENLSSKSITAKGAEGERQERKGKTFKRLHRKGEQQMHFFASLVFLLGVLCGEAF